MSDCSTFECSSVTVSKLNKIVYPTIKGVDGVLTYDLGLALDTYNCAKSKFDSIIGGSLTTEISSQITKIIIESGDASSQIIYIFFGGVAIAFFLLTLIFFAALYWRDEQYAIIGFLVLTILILLTIFIIMFLWISSIYEATYTMVSTNIDNLRKIKKNVDNALLPTLCCIGGIDCTSLGNPCTCPRPGDV